MKQRVRQNNPTYITLVYIITIQQQYTCNPITNMYQSQLKREQFHKQIRQKHHEQIFKKMRTQTNADYCNNMEGQLEPVVNRLPTMYQLSSSIDKIVDNQSQIVEYIGQIRKFQDNEQVLLGKQIEGGAFMRLLAYPLHVAGIIHDHMIMDMQGCQIFEEEYAEREVLYADILLPISYFLINLTSQQLPLSYLEVIAKYTKYRVFIDCFHNIFISDNLTPNLKQLLIDHYLAHLQKYPIFTLNNCNTFTKILYCALINTPSMLDPHYHKYHFRTIKILQKLYSILEFSTKLSQRSKVEFKQYSWIILERLCCKNSVACWEVVNSINLMGSILNLVGDIRFLFLTKGKFDQDFCDETLVAGLSVLVNLTYYDDVAYSVNQCFPAIWLNLLTIYERTAVQTWILQNGNNKDLVLPAIFQAPHFTIITLKILKCISNFICVHGLCEYFISEHTQNKGKLKWNEILTQIYNNQYKCAQIRVQCLCILSNALLIVSRHEQNKTVSNEENQEETTSLQIQVLNGCGDLLLQVLKLHNSNKNIILSVLKTMLFIIEQDSKNIKRCHIFQDHSFINRLTSIAQNNDELGNSKQNKSDYYSDDVRLQAHYLLEAYMINQDRI